MDGGRADLLGRVLRVLLPAVALWMAPEALDLSVPDPTVPRHVLDVSSEHELGPKGCGPFC